MKIGIVFCSVILLGVATMATSQQESNNAKVVFIDAKSTFVVFDKGIVDGINVGSEICLLHRKDGTQIYCGQVVSSIDERSGYFVPPEILARLKPGHGAVVTIAVAEAVPPFAEAMAAAAALREKQKYIYKEEDAQTVAKWDNADSFDAQEAADADQDFFASLSNPGAKARRAEGGEGVRAPLQEGLSVAYMYTHRAPFTFHQIRFNPPQESSAGEEGRLWSQHRKVSSSASGGLVRYTAPDQGGYNLAYDLYGRILLWEENAQNFSPTDKGSSVQTDQTAWSLGGAVRLRYNLLTAGRFRLNPAAGLLLERVSLVFLAKSSTSSGSSDTFTRLEQAYYTFGLTGGLQLTAYFKPVEFFGEVNVAKSLASVTSSMQKTKIPQPDGVTYAGSMTNDIKQAVDLKPSPLAIEIMLGLNYDFVM